MGRAAGGRTENDRRSRQHLLTGWEVGDQHGGGFALIDGKARCANEHRAAPGRTGVQADAVTQDSVCCAVGVEVSVIQLLVVRDAQLHRGEQ